MGGKTAIALGLLAGLVAGGLIVGGAIALAPVPGVGTPSPSVEAPAAPSGSVAPSVPASVPPASVAPSVPASVPPESIPPGSAAPSGSAVPVEPSQSSGAEAFGIGEPARPLLLPGVAGGTIALEDGTVREGALGVSGRA